MIKTTLLSFTCLLLTSCGSEPATDTETPAGNNQEMNGEDHGPPTMTAELTFMERTARVMQFDKVEAGGEIAVTVSFASKEERIKTVRCWVGVESRSGSMVGRLARDGDTDMHGHVEVPDPIPANSMLWIELEQDGKSYVKSFAYH